MKRLVSALLTMALCFSLAVPTFAADRQTVRVDYGKEIVIDGRRVCCQLNEKEVKPTLLYGETVYVPLMTAGQWLGADVACDESAKAVTITHNGKEPVYYTWNELSDKGVTSEDWEDLERGAVLQSGFSVSVDGKARSFNSVAGEPVYPIQFDGYTLLPLEVVGELTGKQKLELSYGFADLVMLFDPPTEAEYDEAKAALAAVRGHLNAVRDIVKGEAPRTENEFFEKLRQAQGHIKAVWTMPSPAFKGIAWYVEDLRDYAELTLWEHIDPYLPVEENSGASLLDSGPQRLIAWEPVENEDGSIVYRPNRNKAPAFDLKKFWNAFTDGIALIAEGKPDYTTYFLGLENTCTESERFLSLVSPALAAEEPYFKDEADIAHPEAVEAVVRLGIMQGREDGSYFEPAGNVTRAEAARMVALLLRGGEDITVSADAQETDPAFPDVKGHWAEKYINYCAEQGAAFPQDDGNFDPNGSIIRQDLLRMVEAVLGYGNFGRGFDFTGEYWVVNTDFLANTLGLYEQLGDLVLFNNGRLDYDVLLTRDEAAYILYGALNSAPYLGIGTRTEDGTIYFDQKYVTRPDGTPSTLLRENFGYNSWDDVPDLPSPTLAAEPVAVVDPTEFADAKDIRYWPAVAALAKLGVIDGKEDGSFDPDGNVARAEAAKMIAVLMNGGSEPNVEAKEVPTFSDIQGHWAEAYIEYCADMSIVNGWDGRFNPDGNVSVVQFYKMALTALGYDPTAYALTGGGWASMTKSQAKMAGLPQGLLHEGMDGTGADQPASREVVAQILCNALQATIMDADPDEHVPGEEIVWVYQPATRQDNGQPETLLHLHFDLEELPTVPAQPTV